MASGDDVETGRVTTGESTTDVVGERPSELDVDFNGPVIFRVGPNLGRQRPDKTLDGIHGLGTNGSVGLGGTGVVGFGGPRKGSGVVGLGSASRNGSGGTGVVGVGGDGNTMGGVVEPGPSSASAGHPGISPGASPAAAPA